MAKASAKKRCGTHLPHQPRKGLGPRRPQKSTELLGQVKQYCAALEHSNRLAARSVDQRWDLAVGIDRDEPRSELVASHDVDQPGIILRSGMPGSEQFLEQNRDLLPIGSALRVKLERMTANRKLAFARRARDRPIDAGETPAALLVPTPHLGRLVTGVVQSLSPVSPRARR